MHKQMDARNNKTPAENSRELQMFYDGRSCILSGKGRRFDQQHWQRRNSWQAVFAMLNVLFLHIKIFQAFFSQDPLILNFQNVKNHNGRAVIIDLEDLSPGRHSPSLSPWKSLRTHHSVPKAQAQVEKSPCGQWGFELGSITM